MNKIGILIFIILAMLLSSCSSSQAPRQQLKEPFATDLAGMTTDSSNGDANIVENIDSKKQIVFVKNQPDKISYWKEWGIIQEFIENYEKKRYDAINLRDFDIIKDFLIVDSEAYKYQKKQITGLTGEHTKVSLVDCELFSYFGSKEEGYDVHVINTVEEDTYRESQNTKLVGMYYYIKRTDGKLGIYEIEDWPEYKDALIRPATKSPGYYSYSLLDNYRDTFIYAVNSLDISEINEITCTEEAFEKQKDLISELRMKGDNFEILEYLSRDGDFGQIDESTYYGKIKLRLSFTNTNREREEMLLYLLVKSKEFRLFGGYPAIVDISVLPSVESGTHFDDSNNDTGSV